MTRKLGNGQYPTSQAQIAKHAFSRVRNVNLLQRARSAFQKPKQAPVVPISVAKIDDGIGGSQSKRAKIKAILRRYEQGAISQSDAAEELLKVMR